MDDIKNDEMTGAAAAPELVTQEWLDLHPDTGLKIGDEIPVVRDYEKERDDRVIPVAVGVISDIANDESMMNIKTQADFTEVLMKILKRALDADLNLVTDNTYVFQLVLGAYGAFSSVVQKAKMPEADDERFAKISQKLLQLLVAANIPMGGKVTAQEQEKAAAVIQPQLEEIFANENLTWLEIKYIMEGLFRTLKGVESLYQRNVDLSLQRMEAKILGVEAMSDVTMSKLNTILKTDASELQKKRDEVNAVV